MAAALVNGIAYDYTQIIVNILGLPVIGISSVNYTEEQEKTNNFGTMNLDCNGMFNDLGGIFSGTPLVDIC